MIEINLYGPFKEIVGEKTVRRDPEPHRTVGDILRSISAEHPAFEEHVFEDGRLRESINVMKNGRNVKLLDGGETPVEDGDRLSVTVSLEGG